MGAAARRVHVVTGADSGLGRAVADRLARDGRVITCGLGENVDIRADLTAPAGRTLLLEQVLALSEGRIDAVVAVAGVGAPKPETVALNYFAAVQILERLRPYLAESAAPAAVVVSSSSSLNRGSGRLVRACISGDEPKARTRASHLIRTGRGSQIYRSTKIALNLWVRTTAVTERWAGAGIVLNAVAPGIIATDTVLRSWERERTLLELALPQPLGAPGPVAAVADLLAALVAPSQRFTTGQVVFADGGTDALTRKDRPQRLFLRYRLRDILTMAREARRLNRARPSSGGLAT